MHTCERLARFANSSILAYSSHRALFAAVFERVRTHTHIRTPVEKATHTHSKHLGARDHITLISARSLAITARADVCTVSAINPFKSSRTTNKQDTHTSHAQSRKKKTHTHTITYVIESIATMMHGARVRAGGGLGELETENAIHDPSDDRIKLKLKRARAPVRTASSGSGNGSRNAIRCVYTTSAHARCCRALQHSDSAICALALVSVCCVR